MDWLTIQGKGMDLLKKYKYTFVILIIGLFLMVLPQKNGEMPENAQSKEQAAVSLQDSLEAILSKISGAGKVSVLLTEYYGEEKIYQVDESVSETSDSNNRKTETVIISDTSREETGLVRSVMAPVYKGAIVVCQGGDRAAVRLAVVEAVSKVTGLSTNQISVLKMK